MSKATEIVRSMLVDSTADILKTVDLIRGDVIRGSKIDRKLTRMCDKTLETAKSFGISEAELIAAGCPEALVSTPVPPGAGHQTGYIREPGDLDHKLHGPLEPPPSGNTLPS